MKLGQIVIVNNSGLGYQNKRLAEMIKPDRILAINSASFSKNTQQHWEWYENFKGYRVDGFPTNHEIKVFLEGLSYVLVCENPLNFSLLTQAKHKGIKVYIQSNYEFCDHLNNNLDLPEKFLMPSYWHVDTMKQKFGQDKVVYLPPPTDPNEFKEARETNFNRTGQIKLLHIVGTLAANDRAGTLDLLEALKYTQADFSLTIKSQHPLPSTYGTQDQRVRYKIGNDPEPQDLYKDFDALIMPRRYGGLSLPTNEALMSGLPVVMTDISPNKELLGTIPLLVRAEKKGEFFTRTMIDYYSADPESLAKKIDWLLGLSKEKLGKLKAECFELGYNNFSPAVLKPKYEELFR